jgi:glutamate formiminotransferase
MVQCLVGTASCVPNLTEGKNKEKIRKPAQRCQVQHLQQLEIFLYYSKRVIVSELLNKNVVNALVTSIL